jgi:hypothetical protein
MNRVRTRGGGVGVCVAAAQAWHPATKGVLQGGIELQGLLEGPALNAGAGAGGLRYPEPGEASSEGYEPRLHTTPIDSAFI